MCSSTRDDAFAGGHAFAADGACTGEAALAGKAACVGEKALARKAAFDRKRPANMKRSAALASLSRDHHQALVAAQRLKRATEETMDQAREAFLSYWASHGEWHFRLEEKMLLPGYAAYGDAYDPLVLRVLGDHVAIRAQADALAATPDAPIGALHRLGEQLATHVRLEERQLFPLIEQAMPPERLAGLAHELEHAGEAGPP